MARSFKSTPVTRVWRAPDDHKIQRDANDYTVAEELAKRPSVKRAKQSSRRSGPKISRGSSGYTIFKESNVRRPFRGGLATP